MAAAPADDPVAAAALGRGLRRLAYGEDAILELLGDDAYSTEPPDVPVRLRRLGATRLSVAARLLFLGLPVARADAERALGAGAVAALRTLGLARGSRTLEPRARILPIGELLVAADSYSRGADDPGDWVAAYTPSSRLLDTLTPRRRVRRALDVGTGSGVQALRAAAHARRVVATDVNPRALAYTRLNAALNGVANVETRLGGLYEPAAGERFDLVTCNAPFVVSPENRWAYRDTPAAADEFSERVVRGAAERLADGGHAAVLVSWVARGRDGRDDRVLGWVAATGCDGWILPAWERDPLDHAAAWNSHLAGDDDAYGHALDEWTTHLDALRIRRITEGAVLLHRREGPIGPPRVDDVDEDALVDASAQVVRAFAGRAALAAGAELDRLALAGELRVERELAPRRRPSGTVTVAGTETTLEAGDAALEVLESLDGRSSLRTHVGRVARRRKLDERATARLQREAERLARDLVELGGLRLGSS